MVNMVDRHREVKRRVARGSPTSAHPTPTIPGQRPRARSRVHGTVFPLHPREAGCFRVSNLTAQVHGCSHSRVLRPVLHGAHDGVHHLWDRQRNHRRIPVHGVPAHPVRDALHRLQLCIHGSCSAVCRFGLCLHPRGPGQRRRLRHRVDGDDRLHPAAHAQLPADRALPRRAFPCGAGMGILSCSPGPGHRPQHRGRCCGQERERGPGAVASGLLHHLLRLRSQGLRPFRPPAGPFHPLRPRHQRHCRGRGRPVLVVPRLRRGLHHERGGQGRQALDPTRRHPHDRDRRSLLRGRRVVRPYGSPGG